MSNINIVALGGLDEKGKNLYCIEVDDRFLLVHCGLKYPEDTQYGVDFIIPDFSYLKENEDRIVGLILTHAHDDVMDGLPYLLKEMDIPVFGPKLCEYALKDRVENLNFTQLPRNGVTDVNGFTVTTFGLTHSIPGALGIAIDTPDGKIVICEQFVVDFDVKDQAFYCDYGAISDIGKNNVLCLMMEAAYSDKVGFTSPKNRITNMIRPYFEDAKGRIFITSYNQNFMRIEEIIALAKEFKYSIYFYNEKLRKNLRMLEESGYYTMPRGMEISPDKFNNDIENVVILVSESGQEIFEIMSRLATGEEDDIQLRDSDTVIIASPVVPGSEKRASSMEDELYKDNVTVYKLSSRDVLSFHPSTDDLKMMLNLLKPKYFIPTMGEYINFVQAANTAMTIGYTPDRIIILDNGQVANFENGTLKNCSTFVKTDETMVGEDNGKNITSFVLRDRETLSTDGVIIIGVAIDYKTKKVIAGPDIQSRGVIYIKDSEYVIKNISKMTTDLIEEEVANGTYDNMAVRAKLREDVAYYVLRETGKRPMILPALLEINLPDNY